MTDLKKIHDRGYSLLSKHTATLFPNSHNVYTPQELVEEILMQVPKLDDGKTFLVLFNLEFVFTLVYTYGVNSKNITFYSDHEDKTAWAENIIGCNVITSLETNMKYNVVVGNPPFQRDNNEAKRWTLWEQFVKRAFDLAIDSVVMITPQSITGPGPFSLIKNNAIIINTNISNYFNVGSTFSYFVTSNNQTDFNTVIISSHGEFECDLKNIDFLPFTINEETLNQINWLKSRKSRVWKRGELHTSRKELFCDNGKHEVIHTNAQVLRSDFEHINLSKIRVCVTLSGYPKFSVIKEAYCSQATMWTEFDTLEEAEAFANECNGEYIQGIMKNFKWSGWNSKDVIEYL